MQILLFFAIATAAPAFYFFRDLTFGALYILAFQETQTSKGFFPKLELCLRHGGIWRLKSIMKCGFYEHKEIGFLIYLCKY